MTNMYIIFVIDNQYYAIKESYLKRFSSAIPCIIPPQNTEYILGFCQIESNTYTIIDSHYLLVFSKKALNDYDNSIYMLIDNEQYHLILPVDEVIGLSCNIEIDDELIDDCKYTRAIFRENEKVGIILDVKELCSFCC